MPVAVLKGASSFWFRNVSIATRLGWCSDRANPHLTGVSATARKVKNSSKVAQCLFATVNGQCMTLLGWKKEVIIVD